jgi:anaerobic glycerol-3-phosphate dehydrogenase
MKTLNDIRTENPALAACHVAKLNGIHTTDGREIPRLDANRGQTRETVAAAIGVRLLVGREIRNQELRDRVTVAIQDADGIPGICVPV